MEKSGWKVLALVLLAGWILVAVVLIGGGFLAAPYVKTMLTGLSAMEEASSKFGPPGGFGESGLKGGGDGSFPTEEQIEQFMKQSDFPTEAEFEKFGPPGGAGVPTN